MNSIISQISAFASAPFFGTITFGITSLVLVSLTWVLVGIIAGKAPKLGYTMEAVYLPGSIISMIFAAAIFMFTGVGKCEFTPLFWTAAAFFVNGAICFTKGLIISRVMQYGPNGIIWAIMQSAMIFPFIFGVAFYNVKLTIIRVIGMVLMLFALGLFAVAKNNKSDKNSSSGSWQLWTFLTMVLGGVDQIAASLPFYYPQPKEISPLYNIFWIMAGYFAIGLIIVCLKKDVRENLKCSVSKLSFWVLCLALLPLAGVFAILFQFPGMRAMADNNLGAMTFPILVGSCVVLFTLYSAVILKEKLKTTDFIALFICVTGQILLCI